MKKQDKRIRILDRELRDEEGVRWDRSPGWLGRSAAASPLTEAERVVVHMEASREVRSPTPEEAIKLVATLREKGATGSVLASTYRSGGGRY